MKERSGAKNTVEHIAEHVICALKKSGHKITPGRRHVIAALAKAGRPLSADEIFERISDKADRATVYRTFALLQEIQALVCFTVHNRHVCELASGHKHYLVCRNCERIEKISPCTLGDIEQASLNVSKKFASLDRHTLQLTGMCKTCARG